MESLLTGLQKEGLLTAEQADSVVKKQEKEGGNAVERLLEDKILEERKIISFLVNNCGYHYVNIDKIEIDPQALAEIPLKIIQENKIIPIRCVKNMLAVLMMDPFDIKTHNALKQSTVLQILPFIGTRKQISETLSKIADNGVPKKEKTTATSTVDAEEGMPLVKHYLFENFVVGTCNEFPYAMAMAVAKASGKSYNPLLLYSEVGLGKTHLMNAVGNYLKKQTPDLQIMYAPCEYFCSRVVSSIKENVLDDFREGCRKVDLLLIDDIQFLRGRNRAQEEFFHIFNGLVQNNKQVVVTSDRPPGELSVLEKRLQSRFMGGSIACIEAPDLETRLAILEKKCGDIVLPQDVKRVLAESFSGNIRDLEGALKTLISFHRFTKKPINKELVQRTLQEMGR